MPRAEIEPVRNPDVVATEPEVYASGFFEGIRLGSRRSAEAVVPLVVELLCPKSVIDVGCGVGMWLAEFQRQGIADVVGIDGDYVRSNALVIEPQNFLARDLRCPLTINRKFDLAISLEVAEHLPPECALGFVRGLVSLSPAVLFSAAVPFQSGEHHLNEQWPDYWAQLFVGFSYTALDCIRPRIWMDDRIDYWYRQNTILYLQTDQIASNSTLKRIADQQPSRVLPLIHPEVYTARSQPASPGVGSLVRAMPGAIAKTVRNRIVPGIANRKFWKQASS